MFFRKKINLTRYKRGAGGIIEFADLLEQAPPKIRANIIGQAKSEDPIFLSDAMRKVVFFEELPFLNEGILAEIMANIPPKVLAYALNNIPEDFRKALLRQLGFRENRKLKDEEEKMGSNVASGLVFGAQRQILKIARKLEAQGKFIFELDNCPRFKLKRQKKVA